MPLTPDLLGDSWTIVQERKTDTRRRSAAHVAGIELSPPFLCTRGQWNTAALADGERDAAANPASMFVFSRLR